MLAELERYQQACREFESGQMHEATWSEALETAFGQELAAKYLYIHMRVEALGEEPTQPAASEPRQRPNPVEQEASPRPRLAGANAQLHKVGEDAVLQAIAAKEVDNGRCNERVWQDALVLAKGDAKNARHHYICLRMDSLRALSARAELTG